MYASSIAKQTCAYEPMHLLRTTHGLHAFHVPNYCRRCYRQDSTVHLSRIVLNLHNQIISCFFTSALRSLFNFRLNSSKYARGSIVVELLTDTTQPTPLQKKTTPVRMHKLQETTHDVKCNRKAHPCFPTNTNTQSAEDIAENP